MNQSITSGLIWSLLLMAVSLPLRRSLSQLMGLEGTAAAAAARYLTIELCVLPAIMVERVAIACLRGAGDMVSGLVVMAIVNVDQHGLQLRALHRARAAARARLDRHRAGHGHRPLLRRGDSCSRCWPAAAPDFTCGSTHAARLRPHPPHPAHRHPRRHRRDPRQHLPSDLLADRAVAGRRGGRRARRRDSSRSARLHAGRRVSDFRRHDGRAIPWRPRPRPRTTQRDSWLARRRRRSWSSPA